MTSRGAQMQLMGPMCWPSDERDVDPAPCHQLTAQRGGGCLRKYDRIGMGTAAVVTLTAQSPPEAPLVICGDKGSEPQPWLLWGP